MILKIFTVYDSKIGAYLPPIYLQSTGHAMRQFEDSVNEEGHAFNKHPADYTIFELGSFDDSNSQFTLLDAKVPLATAVECLTLPDNLKIQAE